MFRSRRYGLRSWPRVAVLFQFGRALSVSCLTDLGSAARARGVVLCRAQVHYMAWVRASPGRQNQRRVGARGTPDAPERGVAVAPWRIVAAEDARFAELLKC